MSREVEQAHEQLARVRALLTWGDPLPQDFLVAAERGSWFNEGSVSPVVSTDFVETPSGLLVPASVTRPAQPMDQFKTYLNAVDTMGAPVPLEMVVRHLSTVPLEVALRWCANWMARLRQPGIRQREVDAYFASSHLREPARTRVLNLLRLPTNVLVTPQGLMCLIKIATRHCHLRGFPDVVDDSAMAFALLGLMEHLSADLGELEGQEDIVISGVPGRLGHEVIANQLANSSRQEAGRWAAFVRCWRELPKELSDHPRMIDLEATYAEVTRVGLDDLVTVCGALWASAINGRPHLSSDYFDSLGWAQERVEAVLALVSATPSQLAQMIADDVSQYGLAWSVRVMEQFPVVRWENGDLTVLDPELVVDRATGAWPMYDILRELESQDRQTESSRVRGAYDHVTETYALEVVRGIAGAGLAGRVYDEEALRTAYGRKRKVADVAVDYGEGWVIMDATTVGLNAMTAAGGSDEAHEQDVAKLVKKAKQIQATVDHIRHDEDKLTGATFPGVRRFYPVVVTASRFPTGPVFMTLLRERLENEGLLQEPDVAAIEVMDFEDLDIVEGLIEDGGPGLLNLLAGKEYSNLHAMSVRDYIILGLGRRSVSRPARVQRGWRAWLDTAAKAFGSAA